MEQHIENESRIRKVLFNEVSFVVASIGLISSFIFWIVNPQNELELELTKVKSQLESNETITQALEKIKNNDLHEVQLRMDRIEERQIKTLEGIARLEALISK